MLLALRVPALFAAPGTVVKPGFGHVNVNVIGVRARPSASTGLPFWFAAATNVGYVGESASSVSVAAQSLSP